MRAAALLLLLCTPALADNAGEARHHFEQGVALFRNRNFDAALSEFQRSHQLQPLPLVRYNVALAERALSRFQEALDDFNRYLDETPPIDRLRVDVARQIAELRKLAAPLLLTVTPPDLELTLDGRPLERREILLLAPGPHVLAGSRDGFTPQQIEVQAEAGRPLEATLELRAIPRTGRLRLTSLTAEVVARVDEQVVELPADLELSPGGHAVTGQWPGFRNARHEVLVVPGETAEVRLALERIPKRRLWERWYFWVPLGAALVGGSLGLGLGLGLPKAEPIIGTLNPFGVQKLN